MGFLRDTFGRRMLARDVDDPIEGTTQTLWPEISNFWAETFGTTGLFISPTMAQRIWVAERCIQLNAQQIASMPVRFHSTAPGGGYRPTWISNPDPVWFPNGIGDALFTIIRNLYGYGFACLLITSRYSSGFPSGWTVLDPRTVTIELVGGRRTYKVNEQPVPAADIVQIDRDPGHALHGTSAIRAYATLAWGLVSSGELSRSFLSGGVPLSVLKSNRRISKEQAEALQAQWVNATSSRGGAPPVLPPEIDFEQLSMSPQDLALIGAMEFGARALASAYGVPSFMLNIPVEGGLTYQNPAMLGEYWWRFELRTTAKRVADAWSAQMLPAGSWTTLDASDTFAPLISEEDDPQRANEEIETPPPIALASPSDAPGSTVVPFRGVGG